MGVRRSIVRTIDRKVIFDKDKINIDTITDFYINIRTFCLKTLPFEKFILPFK